LILTWKIEGERGRGEKKDFDPMLFFRDVRYRR
jgi:hypothetical protein